MLTADHFLTENVLDIKRLLALIVGNRDLTDDETDGALTEIDNYVHALRQQREGMEPVEFEMVD